MSERERDYPNLMAVHLGLVGESLSTEAADERPLVVRDVCVDLVRRQLVLLDAGLPTNLAGDRFRVLLPDVGVEVVSAREVLERKRPTCEEQLNIF